MRTVIRTSQIDVTNDLAALGVSYDVLREAILVGEYARNECTLNDPPNGPGFIAWDKTLRRLKELLIPEGWTRRDYTVIRPDNRMAIAVAIGDEATGDENRTPKTKYPKGAATEVAVMINRQQLELFDQILNRTIIEGGAQSDALQTWMLVRNRVDDTIFCELSLPARLGEDGRVEDWGFRIILQPITLEPNPVSGQSDEGQPIEVTVNRRS